MNIKKIAIVALIMAVALIVTGNSILVYNLMQKEKIDLKKISASVKKDYSLFKKDIESFNKKREEYDEKVASNLFLETIEEYDNWVEIINSYTKTINKIDEDARTLKEKCINKAYTDEDLKNKCSAFIIAYEESINSYVKDITGFNKEVSNIKIKLNEDNISEYEISYDYVDINSDGITAGVE